MEFLESFDQGSWNYLQAQRKPWLDPALVFLSFLAQTWFLAALTGTACLLLLLRRHIAEAGLLCASCLGAFFLAAGLGILIERPPPEVMMRPLEPSLESSSFPSVQTLTATATYLALGLAFRAFQRPRLRKLTPVLAVILALLIGLSRAFIGVNYPSDIAAGWLAGLAWALLCYRIAERWLPGEPGA